MHTETKAMICTAAVLIAMGIFKELAAVVSDHSDDLRGRSEKV